MKAIDLIQGSLQLTDGLTQRLASDMSEASMTPSSPGGKAGDGNHTIWSLGHLCVIEGSIPEILFGENNPVAHWRPLFDMGTEPCADASKYPSFEEVLGTYRDLRAKNAKLLAEIGESGLDRVPKNIPPGFEDLMPTFGRTFEVIALHNMFHLGQVADARRVAGRKRFN